MFENLAANRKIFEYKFENFSKILFCGKSDQKYILVSGKNYILKFSSTNLTLPLEIRKVGPVNDSVLCSEPDRCSMGICSSELRSKDKCRQKLTDVFVKSWVATDSNLVVCYNVYQGYCETIDLFANFSSPPLGKAYSIVTYDLNSHSTILHFENKLYVAVELNAFLNFLSSDFNTISIRTLPNMNIITSEYKVFYPYYGRLGSGLKTIFPLEFKGSFHIHDTRKDVIESNYIFFLVNQPENKIDPKNGKFQMRLVRLCSKDEDFSSFIDIGLNCGDNEAQTYYQIDSWNLAYVGNDLAFWYRNKTRFNNIKLEPEADFHQILYLNLKIIRITDNYKETLDSFVTCAFPIAEIMELFDIVKNKCFKGEGSVNERPYDINSNDSPCSKDDFADIKRGYCGGKMKNKHIIGEHFGDNSVIGYKVISKNGVRGITLNVFQINEKYTIAVIGGSNGILYQFELFENTHQQLASHKLFNDSHFDIKVKEDNITVYGVSYSKIIVKYLINCDNATTCEMCLRSSPFCGWCISSGKCMVQANCAKFTWIPHERNKDREQCPGITFLPTHNILEYSNNIPTIYFNIKRTPKNILSVNKKFLKCQYEANDFISTLNALYYFGNNSIACKGPHGIEVLNNLKNKNYIPFKFKVLINESNLVESVYYIYNCGHSKTCSQCIDNKFNCSWCLNKCVSAYSSTCKKNHEILTNMSHLCPKIEIINKTLAFHVNSSITIYLNSKNTKSYFGARTEFFCFESCDNNTVKATANLSIIQCNFNIIKSLINGVINCTLKVNWRSANSDHGFVESIKPIIFQVYDCIRLSKYCDDCVLLPSMYQCGFCSSIQKCVQKHKCNFYNDNWINQKSQSCPSPIIMKIFPENSTLSSETFIRIDGRNLGFYEKDIQDFISLENTQFQIACIFFKQSYIIAKQFMCKIQNVTDRIDTPVIFQFVFRSKSHLAKKEFRFFTPNVTSIEPLFGPFIGGTIIKIFGRYLNIGLKREINFKKGSVQISCVILRNLDGFISCRIEEFISNAKLIRIKRSFNSQKAVLHIAIDKNVISFNDVQYTFFPNPIIIKMSRNKILSNGGQIMKFMGSNLQFINKPCLAFYCNHTLSIYETCWVNNLDIYCITPKAINVTNSLECQLILGMENGTVCIYNSTITIFPVPIFEKVREKIILPSTPFSFITNKPINDKMPLTFEIKDKISMGAFTESDLNISIGSLPCANMTLSGNTIHCKISVNEIDIYKKYDINLKIGKNVLIILGFTQFEKGDISLDKISVIIITIFIIFLLVAVIIVSVIVVKKVQRKQILKNRKQNIFTERVIKEANEMLKRGITELNQVSIQDDIHKNWSAAPIYPYNVYILYNLFPNTHPRLSNESRNTNESIFDLSYYNYNSSDPTTHPLIFDKQIQVIENTVEYSRKLSKLFEDELFVLLFFTFLENHQEVDSKKSDIISFLSLILMKDMSNYTKILKILIKNDYDKKKVIEEEKSMFRQSDLLSKLLSNWFFILMYDHLQNINAGGDLLILYLNILNVINNGPVNYETNKCQYALNENSLLERKVEFNKLSIKVRHPNFDMSDEIPESEITVLDCDCITQVKLKILEDIHKYSPYSKWGNLDDFDLAKVNYDENSESEQLLKSLVLKELVNNTYKTLKDYDIINGDILRLVYKSASFAGSNTDSLCPSIHMESNSASLKTNQSRNIKGPAPFNFTPEICKKTPTHKLVETFNEKISDKSKLSCFPKSRTHVSKDGTDIKQICLIYTLVLKNKIEQQIKNFFDDIFDYESVPFCVIDLFTHLNNICKDESVVFSVKSNSLILRFWIQLINNIDFLFDIPLSKHTPVLECLKCISRVLMDICSENQNKDVWLTQLFSDMIKIYSPKVLNYYEGINNTSNSNSNDYYPSSRIDGINISLAIVILYQHYIKIVHTELVEEIKNSNYPKEKQNEWILILDEVNNLYIPEQYFSDDNGDIKTTFC